MLFDKIENLVNDKYVLRVILLCLLSLIIVLLMYSFGVFENKGYYLINDMWIGNTSPQNLSCCDNCLWITFNEGCNKYQSFYFENQHEFDNRLSIGMSVDINFRKCGKNLEKYCINGVIPRKEYLRKC